jgi:hypothetical protein
MFLTLLKGASLDLSSAFVDRRRATRQPRNVSFGDGSVPGEVFAWNAGAGLVGGSPSGAGISGDTFALQANRELLGLKAKERSGATEFNSYDFRNVRRLLVERGDAYTLESVWLVVQSPLQTPQVPLTLGLSPAAYLESDHRAIAGEYIPVFNPNRELVHYDGSWRYSSSSEDFEPNRYRSGLEMEPGWAHTIVSVTADAFYPTVSFWYKNLSTGRVQTSVQTYPEGAKDYFPETVVGQVRVASFSENFNDHQNFPGLVAKAAVYDRALPESQVRALLRNPWVNFSERRVFVASGAGASTPQPPNASIVATVPLNASTASALTLAAQSAHTVPLTATVTAQLGSALSAQISATIALTASAQAALALSAASAHTLPLSASQTGALALSVASATTIPLTASAASAAALAASSAATLALTASAASALSLSASTAHTLPLVALITAQKEAGAAITATIALTASTQASLALAAAASHTLPLTASAASALALAAAAAHSLPITSSAALALALRASASAAIGVGAAASSSLDLRAVLSGGVSLFVEFTAYSALSEPEIDPERTVALAMPDGYTVALAQPDGYTVFAPDHERITITI